MLLRMREFPYAVWLMPCAEQREALQEIIGRLAFQFGTPSFAPHTTLCSGVWKKNEAELIEAVRGRLGQPSLPIKTNGIGWTEHWSTFFFLRLNGAPDLFAQVASQIVGSHPPAIGPHLSLLYGLGDKPIDREALRDELAGTLSETIYFDSLALVRPSSGRWENIEAWQIKPVRSP